MIRVSKDIESLKDEIIKIRRDLHMIPEIGFEEYKTGRYIANYLRGLNVEIYDKVAKTGVLAYIKGVKGEKTIAVRADMDALTVHEKTNVPFCSMHDGKMHACGHDGHMAIVLGLAKYLSLKRNKLKDNILLIFQPAEEGPGGAEVIIEEGILRKFNVNTILGLHLYPEIEEGKIGVRPGPMMAQTGEFDIFVKGKSGHGAMPQNSVDSIIVSANFINSIQSIISRNINPISPAVITIGRIEGGERRNVIAGEVTMEGTIRAFDESIYNTIKQKIISFANSFNLAYNCQIDVVFRDMYPSVYNNDKLVSILIETIGKENVEIIEPQMISEDFSYYQKEVPGLFFFLGVRNNKKGYVYPLHNSKFNFDDNVLALGVQVFVDMLKHTDSLEK